MGGIWFQSEVPQLVTLTTQPYEVCEPYHHRMPYLISHDDAMHWLTGGRSRRELCSFKDHAIHAGCHSVAFFRMLSYSFVAWVI